MHIYFMEAVLTDDECWQLEGETTKDSARWARQSGSLLRMLWAMLSLVHETFMSKLPCAAFRDAPASSGHSMSCLPPRYSIECECFGEPDITSSSRERSMAFDNIYQTYAWEAGDGTRSRVDMSELQTPRQLLGR